MATVEVGEGVSLTELDSEPPLLVLDVGEDLTGALLADLANETIQRLEATGRVARRLHRPSRTWRVS